MAYKFSKNIYDIFILVQYLLIDLDINDILLSLDFEIVLVVVSIFLF